MLQDVNLWEPKVSALRKMLVSFEERVMG